MSGCAHARMGILGPHPSPECEDARPSLPALRSGWAILILRGRDHGLITSTPQPHGEFQSRYTSHPFHTPGARRGEPPRQRGDAASGIWVPGRDFTPLARCNSHVRFSHRLISHISYAYRVESHIIVNIA